MCPQLETRNIPPCGTEWMRQALQQTHSASVIQEEACFAIVHSTSQTTSPVLSSGKCEACEVNARGKGKNT